MSRVWTLDPDRLVCHYLCDLKQVALCHVYKMGIIAVLTRVVMMTKLVNVHKLLRKILDM